MNEAEIRKWRILRPCNHDFNTIYCTLCMISDLLAHIDAQAAEITDREGKYVDLLRTKHALTAEVERLKETNSRLNRRCQAAEKGVRENVEACRKQGVSLGRALANGGYRMMEEKNDSLRDLVREAGERIDDLTTYGAAATVRNEKAWSEAVAKADAWQKKAQT